MELVRWALALAALAGVFCLGSRDHVSAAGRTPLVVKTLVTTSGAVTALAQDGAWLAWQRSWTVMRPYGPAPKPRDALDSGAGDAPFADLWAGGR